MEADGRVDPLLDNRRRTSHKNFVRAEGLYGTPVLIRVGIQACREPLGKNFTSLNATTDLVAARMGKAAYANITSPPVLVWQVVKQTGAI